MSYSVVGLYYDSSMVCVECARQDLTEQEISFLQYGPDNDDGTMDLWPVKDSYGDYELDELGEKIFKENVKIKKVLRQGEEIHRIIDDGSDDGEGYYCDGCNSYFVEPYNVTCWDCSDVVASGDKAVGIDQEMSSSEIFCRSCVDKKQKAMLSSAIESMEVDLVRLLESRKPILTILGKITGLDKHFDPRLVSLTRTIERIREATDIFDLKEEIEAELTGYAYFTWQRPAKEHIDILSTCLEVLNDEIDMFADDNDVKVFLQLQKRLAA